jgi:hypothetical protein
MIDLVCVCVGDRYSPELYVGQLYQAVKRHCNLPYNFHVITDSNIKFYDSINAIVHVVPDWPEANGLRKYWWYKIQMFNPEHGFKNVLYLDLDMIIVGDLDKFINYHPKKFAVCQDFNSRWIPDYSVSNTSIIRFHAPDHTKLYTDFVEDIPGHIKRFRGDQDYVTHYLREKSDWIWWPKTWAQSFKWDVFRGGLIESGTGLDQYGKWPAPENMYCYPEQPWILDTQCSIVVFHGDPDPYYTDFGKQHLLPDT